MKEMVEKNNVIAEENFGLFKEIEKLKEVIEVYEIGGCKGLVIENQDNEEALSNQIKELEELLGGN